MSKCSCSKRKLQLNYLPRESDNHADSRNSVRENRLSDSRESSSTGQLIKILSHENNEQKFDEDERLLQLMKERLVKKNVALTAQSVGKEISSSKARMSMAQMKYEKLTKIS